MRHHLFIAIGCLSSGTATLIYTGSTAAGMAVSWGLLTLCYVIDERNTL